MDQKTIVIGLVIGLLIGAGLGYGVSASQANTLQGQITTLNGQVTSLKADANKVPGLQKQVTDLTADKTSLTSQVTTLQGQLTMKTDQLESAQVQIVIKDTEISALTADKAALMSQATTLQEQLTSAQIQIAARDSQIAALQKLVPVSKFLSTSLYPAVQIGSYVYQLGFSLSNGSPWTITVTGVEFFDKDILWHTISTDDIKEIWGTDNVEAGESFSGHLSFQLPYPIEEINDWQVTWHCLDSDGVEFDVTGP